MKIVSPIASIARGSIAGITATANQFQQIVFRQRTAPVQPNTVMQTKIRAAFTSAQTSWEGLSQANRDLWDDYADSLTFTGPTGDYKVPGRQVYLSNYGWSLYLFDRGVPNQVALTTPPEETGFAAIQILNIEPLIIPGTGFQVTGWNPNPESINVIVMNSRAFHPSRKRYKGPFKSNILYSATVNPASGFFITVYPLIDGSRYFCSVRAITLDPAHRLSAKFYLNTIATTTEADIKKSTVKKAA